MKWQPKMRLTAAIVVGLGMVMASVATVDASSESIEQASYHTPGDGLGDYGKTGLIERSSLPPGIDIVASDQAIAMANSELFADARQNWEGEIDFVGQIDYQLAFRPQSDYLSYDTESLATLLELRPLTYGIESLGLYMTDDEVMELERRQALGDLMPSLVEMITGVDESTQEEADEPDYGTNFGGIWQDQLNGGVIIIAVGDASLLDIAALNREVGGAANLRVLDHHPSWDGMNDQYVDLILDLRSAGVPAEVAITSVATGRKFEIRTPEPAKVSAVFLSRFPEGMVTVIAGAVDALAGDPQDVHVAGDQQPGLYYDSDPGGGCTWGTNGHTNSYNYIVTAGHCGDAPYENWTSGFTSAYEIDQANSFNLTPGSQYLYSFFEPSYDAKRMSSPYADDNCYHWGHCSTFIVSRALHNSWEINSDLSCASLGKTNQYRCGYVIQENYVSTGCNGTRWFRVSFGGTQGDSGSGLIKPATVYGTVLDGMYVCTSGSSNSLAQTAYDTKTKLAFDFNCWPTATVKAPGSWGACTAIDR